MSLQCHGKSNADCVAAAGCWYDDGQCKSCDQGKYSPADSNTCDLCAPGSSSAFGQGSCTPCEKGKYANSPGQAMCDYCPVGKYTDKTGTVECSACEGNSASVPYRLSCQICSDTQLVDATHSECVDCTDAVKHKTIKGGKCVCEDNYEDKEGTCTKKEEPSKASNALVITLVAIIMAIIAVSISVFVAVKINKKKQSQKMAENVVDDQIAVHI